jgi:hypothetical protein
MFAAAAPCAGTASTINHISSVRIDKLTARLYLKALALQPRNPTRPLGERKAAIAAMDGATSAEQPEEGSWR